MAENRRRNWRFSIVVGSIMLILAALLVNLEYLKYQRAKEVSQTVGNDEQSRLIREEAEEYRNTNCNQQFGICAVGGVIIFGSLVWWMKQSQKKLG